MSSIAVSLLPKYLYLENGLKQGQFLHQYFSILKLFFQNANNQSVKRVKMTIDNYTTYHENFDGITAAWRYCERRMLFAKSETIGTDSTYESIYRKFIQWVKEYSAYLAIVDEKQIENNTTALLETSVSSLGTVYVTQRNVVTYFTQVVVNLAGTSTASLKKKSVASAGFYRM